MDKIFEQHMTYIIQRLKKQIMITATIFVMMVLVGTIMLLMKQRDLSVILFIFSITFLFLTLFDSKALKTNQQALLTYHNQNQEIEKQIKKQLKRYDAQGKGLINSLLVLFYKPLIRHYELALDALSSIKKSS